MKRGLSKIPERPRALTTEEAAHKIIDQLSTFNDADANEVLASVLENIGTKRALMFAELTSKRDVAGKNLDRFMFVSRADEKNISKILNHDSEKSTNQ